MPEALPPLEVLERVARLPIATFSREAKRASDLESLTTEQLAEQAVDPTKLILSEKFTVESVLVESYTIKSSEHYQGGSYPAHPPHQKPRPVDLGQQRRRNFA